MNTKDIIGKTLTWEHTNPAYRNNHRYIIINPKAIIEEIRREYKSYIEVLLNYGNYYSVMNIPRRMIETLISGKEYHTDGGKTVTMS